ncbi:hypothetical protein BGZ80_009394 [Entomortierella chlamydospora]|uniref:Uncharacterized protein n=1 Tax=Entomortierella chlamydospora TaxID=101097 RepID=A0A9P6T0H9_9FUNG|nr:hypothetical protein BGZ80_009394 [Entomortierella chlamydospora]
MKNKKKDGGDSGGDNDEEVKAKTRNISDRVHVKLALGKLHPTRSLPIGSLKGSILLVHGITPDQGIQGARLPAQGTQGVRPPAQGIQGQPPAQDTQGVIPSARGTQGARPPVQGTQGV